MFGESNDPHKLAKLAALRARAILDSVECEIQNAGPIHSANPPRRHWPSWSWIFGFIIFAGYVASKYAAPDDAPDCDDESVRQRVVQLANQQSQALTEPILGAMLGATAEGIVAKVTSVTNGHTLFHDKGSGFRACIGNAAIAKDRAPIGFTIEWQDKEKGRYLVELSNAAALEVRYGIAASPRPAGGLH
jgi:hypothetical protein